jgi:phosphate/sulfate permease
MGKAIPGKVGNRFLMVTMCYSALVLGLNDVSNAASLMIGAGLDEYISRFISEALMGAGLIIWGSRLVKFIGGEIGISYVRYFLAGPYNVDQISNIQLDPLEFLLYRSLSHDIQQRVFHLLYPFRL